MYTSPTWVNVPPNTVPPPGAVALSAENMQELSDAVAALASGGVSGFKPVGPKTANYTAHAGEFVLWDTTSGSLVMTLPTAPPDQSSVGAKIVILGAGHTVTINCGGSDVFNKTGGGTSLVLSLVDQAYQLEYHSGVWVVTGIDLSLTQLDARYGATYEPKHSTVFQATGGTDAAAIAAAFTSMQGSGHARGTLVLKGNAFGIVGIDTPVVLDGGFSDVANSSDANAVGEAGRFRVVVDGVLNVTASIGTALTIKGFRGAQASLNFTGGMSSDVALDIQNLVDFDLERIHGNQFAGTLLHADASSDATKLVSESYLRSIHAEGCGRAINFKGINAFGKIGEIQDIESTNGSIFDTCADIAIGYINAYSNSGVGDGFLFTDCGNFAIDTVEMGDRPSEALIKIVRGNFGRLGKIRLTGQPGVGTPSISGLKLVDVTSVEVGMLETGNCAKGLHIQGGGGASTGSIRVLHHRSLTSDVNPLYIEAGASTSAPLIEVTCRYRNHQAQSAYIASSITGGELHLSGLIDTPNNLGAGGIYAVDCQSTTMIVDVTGLQELHRTTLAGSVNSVTPANIIGVSKARLADPVVHGAVTSATTPVSGTDYQNLTGRTMNCFLTIRSQPSTTSTEIDISLGPTEGGEVTAAFWTRTIAPDTTGSGDQTDVLFFRVPPYWWYTATKTGTVTINSLKYFLD